MGDKLTKEELQTMIKDIIAEQMDAIKASGQLVDGTVRVAESPDVRTIMQDMGLVSSVGANGLIFTEKGSVLNPNQPHTPWVKLSKEMEDFAEVFKEGTVDAALAASVFHFGEIKIKDLKEYLQSEDISMRL